ncbi:CHRD domain-containing protein [Streptomyces collinus]|uniref:CHRD domain-containing protein n=1 Tax=Streptomyces collinus TaxID=42684 RepID=UPI00362DA023
MSAPGRRQTGDELSPSWWQQDPDRWDLLRFDGFRQEAGYTVDRWWKDRERVLEAFIREAIRADHDFALFLLDQEVQRHENSWGFSHSIEIAALLVAEHRHVDDVWPLWEAICRSFDTWCGIPHRLLFAGGVTRTLEHVGNSSGPQRNQLLERLQEHVPLTDEDVTALLAERRQYYVDILDDRHPGPDAETTDA